MKIFRRDYAKVDGKFVSVRSDRVYGWAPLNTETGEVDLESFHEFDDELFELSEPWEWREFNLTLNPYNEKNDG